MRTEVWPDADALFRSDPRFLGSDDAYSVPIAEDRTLWLFGDTFVGDGEDQDRRHSTFIRNSIGIQTGNDPNSATIDFHWRTKDKTPDSFFETLPGEWLWPLHGIRIEDDLLLFFMQVRAPRGSGPDDPIQDWREQGPLSFFDVYDWTAFIIRNPDDHPDSWKVESADRAPNPLGIVTGASLLIEGDHLISFGWKDHNVFLSRWPKAEAAGGDLRKMQWWNRDDWSDDADDAASVADEAKTEFTVHRGNDGRYCMVQMRALIGANMAVRYADEPQGPWSPLEKIYDPPEQSMPGVMTYAGKAHPQLSGADLVLTYASNGATADATLDTLDVYFPRFVKAFFEES